PDVAEPSGAETETGRVEGFGFEKEREGDPLVVEAEEDGGGAEDSGGNRRDGTRIGAAAQDRGAEIGDGSARGEPPDVVRGARLPGEERKAEGAGGVEREQEGRAAVGHQDVEGFEGDPEGGEQHLRLPEGRAGVAAEGDGSVGGNQAVA